MTYGISSYRFWRLFCHRYRGMIKSVITIPMVLPYHSYRIRGITTEFFTIPW